jgi:hypothetical protein
MLNSVKKIRETKKNILTIVLSENKFLNETKNHNPSCKLNGRSLTLILNTVVMVRLFPQFQIVIKIATQ